VSAYRSVRAAALGGGLVLLLLAGGGCRTTSPPAQADGAAPSADGTAPAGEGGSPQYEFQAGQWVNSPPLTLAGLHGKVVLVDFWEYTCINCLRTLPYLQAWWQRYAASGLVIVGIHTPEFAFGTRPENVIRATRELGITWPVLLDPEGKNWSAFGTNTWPHEYLFDASGKLIEEKSGEGNYQETELKIQKALRAAGVKGDFPTPWPPVRSLDVPGAQCYAQSPELYLGADRGEIGNPEGYRLNQKVSYARPTAPRLDHWYLVGEWRIGHESVETTPGPGEQAIVLDYQGNNVNIVLHPPLTGPGRMVLRLDGGPLPRDLAGRHVKFTDAGEAYVTVDYPRMYDLVDSPHWGRHLLEMQFQTPGTFAYSFTFGTECKPPGA
jgi:thiol-disulfide isomerase/thioredoxin